VDEQDRSGRERKVVSTLRAKTHATEWLKFGGIVWQKSLSYLSDL